MERRRVLPKALLRQTSRAGPGPFAMVHTMRDTLSRFSMGGRKRRRRNGARVMGHPRSPIRLSIAVSFLFLMAGCDPEGLKENARALLDPPPTQFDVPGFKIVAGDFSQLEQVGREEGVITFSARRTFSDGDHLLLIRFQWADVRSRKKTPEEGTLVCDAGPVTRVDWNQKWNDETGSSLAFSAFFDPDGDGLGTLRFFDAQCMEILPAIERYRDEAVSANWEEEDGTQWVLFGRDESGTVYRLEPESRRVDAVLTGVTHMFSLRNGAAIAFVQAGQLVIHRPNDLARLETWGDGVVDAYQNQGFAFFRDKDGLFRLNATGEKAVKIADDGCQARAMDYYVFFFFPCDSRQLHISWANDDARLGSAKGPVLPGPITSARKFTSDASSGLDSAEHLLFVADDGSSPPGNYTGSLYVVNDLASAAFAPTFEAVQVADRGGFCSGGVCLRLSGLAGDYYSLANLNGQSLIDRLRGEPTLRGFVGPVTARSFLTDFDGKTASLRWLGESEAPQTNSRELASGILYGRPPFQIKPAGQLSTFRAFGTESVTGEPFKGIVFVNDPGPVGGNLRTLVLDGVSVPSEPLAQNVLDGSPEVLAVIEGIAYLTAGADRTLSVYLSESGLNQEIAKRVTRYFEINAPAPGLVYVVDKGDNAGIWFAPAR